MPLHRDIHWIGRQWAVTGHGMQLIDQKQKGFFDIEVVRLWDEAVMTRMRAQDWVNVADFDKGMEVARKRYKEQSRAVPPPPVQIEKPAELPPQQPESIAPDEPAPGKFQMRFSGVAKFIRPWRVRNRE